MVTPTTKATDHDVPLSPEEIVRQGLVTHEDWDTVSSKASPPAGCTPFILLSEQHPGLGAPVGAAQHCRSRSRPATAPLYGHSSTCMVMDVEIMVPCGAEGSAKGCCSLQISSAALELFAYGQAEAAKRGLLLVDTKYEFGRDSEGTIRLIDEIHTPDSSRHVPHTCALLCIDVSEGTARECPSGLRCVCRVAGVSKQLPGCLASQTLV